MANGDLQRQRSREGRGPETTKNPIISDRAFGGVKWARTIDLYDVKIQNAHLMMLYGVQYSLL